MHCIVGKPAAHLPLPEHHLAVAQDLALWLQGIAFSELEFYLPDLHPRVAHTARLPAAKYLGVV